MSASGRNLVVRLRPDAVVVSMSQLGREEGRLTVDLALEAQPSIGDVRAGRDLETFALDRPPNIQDPEIVGTRLHQAIFEGERKALFERSRGPHQDPVRIVLEIDPRAAHRSPLTALPWELLYNPREQRFLALQRETPVVRRIPVAVAPRPLPRAGRLRILAVAAAPEDMDRLDLAAEVEGLRTLSRRAGIKVETLVDRDASVDAIRRALERVKPHVLHFMGHGSFDPSSGHGRLHLVGPKGQSELISGIDLASLLPAVPSLRLVVINACDSARTGDAAGAAMAGVSNAVVLAGIPSVIAMQRPIRDDAAVVFARELYQRIEAGEPVDQATTLARQAMRTAVGAIEWSTPVLFVGDVDQLCVFRPSLAVALRKIALVAFPVLALALVLALLPARSAPFDLEVTAHRVGIQVAEVQKISPPIAVDRLVARDLRAVQLPSGESLHADTSPIRLDIDLRVGGGAKGRAEGVGSLTLLPIVATGPVRLSLTEVRAGRFRLAVSALPLEGPAEGDPAEGDPAVGTPHGGGLTRGVAVATVGAWQLRQRGGGWHHGANARPAQLALVPHDQISVDLDVAPGTLRDLDEAVTATSLSLTEVREVPRGGRTDIERISTLIGGRLRVGSRSALRSLDPDDVVALEFETLRIERFALSAGEGISLRASGVVSEAQLTPLGGPMRSLMPSVLDGLAVQSRGVAIFGVCLLLASAVGYSSALGRRRPRFGFPFKPHFRRRSS